MSWGHWFEPSLAGAARRGVVAAVAVAVLVFVVVVAPEAGGKGGTPIRDAVLVGLVALPIAHGGVAGSAASGTLALHARFTLKATSIDCPAEVPSGTYCLTTEGTAVVPGLGTVTETYLRTIQEHACGFHFLSQTVHFNVADKGEIRVSVPETADCLPSANRVVSFPSAQSRAGRARTPVRPALELGIRERFRPRPVERQDVTFGRRTLRFRASISM
jgi:hypothetical protein